jgi:hypothetical protein
MARKNERVHLTVFDHAELQIAIEWSGCYWAPGLTLQYGGLLFE